MCHLLIATETISILKEKNNQGELKGKKEGDKRWGESGKEKEMDDEEKVTDEEKEVESVKEEWLKRRGQEEKTGGNKMSG